MTEYARHIIYGFLVFFIFIGVGAISFTSGRIQANTGFLVNATFNQIDGLQIGDEVRLAGIRIGEVVDMKLGNGYSAQVVLRLEPDMVLPTDSSAAIHTDGLFGAKYVTFLPGGMDENIASGGEVELTQDSVVVQDLLELIIGEGKVRRAKAEEDAGAAK